MHSLQQHNLQRIKRSLLLSNITDIKQKILKEDLIHSFGRTVGMRPYQEYCVFTNIHDGKKCMRTPGWNFVNAVVWSVYAILGVEARCSAYFTLEDDETFRLFEVEVEGGTLLEQRGGMST